MPNVEIVILNWNGEEHLRRFLPSVVAAAPEGVGVVVADNGSTDGSVALLEREFPSVGVVRLERNYGFAGGYNRALERIEAEYFVLLNSDVETPPGWLEPLLDCLRRHPDVAVVSPKLLSFRDRGRFEYAGASGGFIDFLGYPFCRGRILRSVECDAGQYDDARDVFWVSGAAFCCRADVFRALGGFDADFFAHMEEIDLCWRMQLAGACGWFRRAGSITSAAARSLPTLRPRSSTTTAMTWRCSTSAPRRGSAPSWPSCARGSICWRPCRIWCRGVRTVSGRCSAPGATFSAGTGSWPASGARSGRPAGDRPPRISTAGRFFCAICWDAGPSAG